MDATRDYGLRILIVDDNDSILKAMGGLLKAIGYSVTEASNVCKALSILECQPIDLLISDIDLGIESGLDLIQSLRQTSEIPAIAMSAQSDMSEPSLASGFSVFLDKPVSRQALQQTIRLVIRGESVPEPGPEPIDAFARRRG
jgi:two-component system response regulator HydG